MPTGWFQRLSDPKQAKFNQKPEKVGLLVTGELNKAVEECKAKVARISKECRAKNRKFRDTEFDIENDRERCLHGLDPSRSRFYPSDIQRVTQIFDNPQFFIDGAGSNDIVQGPIGDCWFLSALSTMSTSEGLVEKSCVARDEEVGVYGFIIFRDSSWVTVIIDDLLFVSIPKFEELSYTEKALYHHSKEKYNSRARKGGNALYFSRSATPGETWVPLIEKAYAKLHGDYQAMDGGYTGEAIEDLTGGVSSKVYCKDILDREKFWREELLNVHKDRLFGSHLSSLDTSRSGEYMPSVNGLIGGHAYSVLRALEYNGKKFLVVRNPWGNSEWNGPWSDGSAEWTMEWLAALPVLQHTFGNDGQFVMDYDSFLESFEVIDRTRLFDGSWSMSSQWLEVVARPLPSAVAYGDVSFTMSLDKPSSTVIVLSRIDDRYFNGINGRSFWILDFVIFKEGETERLTETLPAHSWERSVNLEVDLEAGNYVVHVRLDRQFYREEKYFENASKAWDERKLSMVLTERAKGQSIASNFKVDPETPPTRILEEIAIQTAKRKTPTPSVPVVQAAAAPEVAPENPAPVEPKPAVVADGGDDDAEDDTTPDVEVTKDPITDIWAAPDSIVLGLRVYSQGARVDISGEVAQDTKAPSATATAKAV